MLNLARAVEKLPFVALVEALETSQAVRVRLGGEGPLRDEAVRFAQDPSLAFHTADITSARPVSGEAPHVLITTTFAGVLGATSPLPPGMIEEYAHDCDEPSVQRDLLDGFHHRLVSLLYRGLVRADLTRSIDLDACDGMAGRLLLLAGICPEVRGDTGLPTGLLFRLLPLLHGHAATATRLEQAVEVALRDTLGASAVRVAAFSGTMMRLDDDALPRLGVDVRLGRTSSIGRRVAMPARAARLTIGPLDATAHAALAPGGALFATLRAVISLCAPETVDIDVELHPTGARPARLGKGHGTRLGLNGWLGKGGTPAPVRFRVSSSPQHE